MNAFSSRILSALKRLTAARAPHPCGGFTTDDIEWQMGVAFTPEQTLHESLDELTAARLIRYAGYDEEDAIGHCYALGTKLDTLRTPETTPNQPIPTQAQP